MSHAAPSAPPLGPEILLGAGRLQPGDVVTHVERGLAVLGGLEEVEGVGDMIRLRFADDEEVLIPASDAGLLYRHGAAPARVGLDQADGDWTAARGAIEDEMRALAEQLVALDAARGPAPAIEPSAGAMEAVAKGFGHELTPGQRAALDAILADIAEPRATDRVLIGDVGYGKTEVALRAAAAAVSAGCQVVVAAPTTLLCRQHAELFAARLQDARVVRLSSLETEGEAEAAREAMRSGEADVIVGTHALTTEPLAPARLGLVIIDEEQRFGAERKDDLRHLAEGAHVLTLTATPIPRTLAAAEVGLQAISVLGDPVPGRQAVETMRGELTRKVLADALAGGARRFVVSPRIEDMDDLAALVLAAVPDARLVRAHGKMSAGEAAEALGAFASGEADTLLATAIVESGLDVPDADVMVIARPERFGLAQLHQLRGRVGRGGQSARLHLLCEPGAELTEEGEARLDALVALSRLGAGFEVAARDMAERGVGELVGEEQSGHLGRLGLGLHRALLARALTAAKGTRMPLLPPDIGACGGGGLPPSYVPDEAARLSLLVRIGHADSRKAIRVLAEEMEAEHGPPPAEAEQLLAAAGLRALCRQARVCALVAGPKGVALTFEEGAQGDAALGERVAAAEDAFGPAHWSNGRLVFEREAEDPCAAATELVAALRA